MNFEKITQKSILERRTYYRLKPTVPEKVEAAIFFLDGSRCSAEVINLSPAGLLCYCTTSVEKFHLEDIFPRIDLHIPHKPVVTYAGRLVRKEATGDPKAFYFAIKFEKFGGIEGVKIPSRKKGKPLGPEADDLFLTRLRQAENFMRAASYYEETRLRTRLYHSFEDVTARLRLEEKWFFLELLDELKRQEPAYSPGLLKEFLRLCRGEERLTQGENPKKITALLSGLFHPVKE